MVFESPRQLSGGHCGARLWLSLVLGVPHRPGTGQTPGARWLLSLLLSLLPSSSAAARSGPDAVSLLSSARVLPFSPFLAGLPAASSWVRPVTAAEPGPGAAHAPPLAQRHRVVVSGKPSSKLSPLHPRLLWPALLTVPQTWRFLLNPPPSSSASATLSCSQHPGPSNSQPSSAGQSLMALSSPSPGGCHHPRSGRRKLLPGALKLPPHWSPFLWPVSAFPD